MKSIKCCYMDRECTPECVAYNVDEAVSTGIEEIGLKNMHCVRLLMELTNSMNAQCQFDLDDFDEDDFDY